MPLSSNQIIVSGDTAVMVSFKDNQVKTTLFANSIEMLDQGAKADVAAPISGREAKEA
jgi:hypothetical protein